MPKRTNVISLS